MKLRIAPYKGGEQRVFYCPGCKTIHAVNETWGFNGNLEKPTFTPSVLCNRHDEKTRCHLFVRDGQIEYLSDCHHELAGKTVPLPDLPDWAL